MAYVFKVSNGTLNNYVFRVRRPDGNGNAVIEIAAGALEQPVSFPDEATFKEFKRCYWEDYFMPNKRAGLPPKLYEGRKPVNQLIDGLEKTTSIQAKKVESAVKSIEDAVVDTAKEAGMDIEGFTTEPMAKETSKKRR